jgi:hypothetical protein
MTRYYQISLVVHGEYHVLNKRKMLFASKKQGEKGISRRKIRPYYRFRSLSFRTGWPSDSGPFEALEMPIATRNLLSPLLPAPKVDKLVFCRVKSTKNDEDGIRVD